MGQYGGGFDGYTETAFRFVSENTSHGETATEKVGVHPILVWWRWRELNPRPKDVCREFLRAQSLYEHSLAAAPGDRLCGLVASDG